MQPGPRHDTHTRGRRSALLPALGCPLLAAAAVAAIGGFVWLAVRHGAVARGVILAAASLGFWFWIRSPRRWQALKRGLGLARGVTELARRLGISEDELRAARPSYREVRIPKRRSGHRTLHVPDDATKALQRTILHRLLAKLPAHPAATGFEKDRSVATNAAQHVGRAVVLRFDVVDFFPTTHAGRIERMFLRFGWNREAAELLVRLTTHEGGLPQGAPTSPRLSNLVNVALDRELTRFVERKRGRYTRYADDVTISFPEDWIGVPEKVRAMVVRSLALRGYRIHGSRKTSVRRRHQQQLVTGLVVNDRVAVPRRIRRLLRAARHHLATGRPATFTPEQLAGWAAYEAMVAVQGADVPPPFVRTGPRPSSPRRR